LQACGRCRAGRRFIGEFLALRVICLRGLNVLPGDGEDGRRPPGRGGAVLPVYGDWLSVRVRRASPGAGPRK